MTLGLQDKKIYHDLQNAICAVEIVLGLLQKKYDFNSRDGQEMIEEAKASVLFIRSQMTPLELDPKK